MFFITWSTAGEQTNEWVGYGNLILDSGEERLLLLFKKHPITQLPFLRKESIEPTCTWTHWQSVEMNNHGKLLLWDAHSQSPWESGCSRIPQSPYVAPIEGVPFCYSWETPFLEPGVLQGHPWPSEQIQSINHRKKTCFKSSALERWRCIDSNTVWIFKKKRNKMSKSTEV